MKDINKHLRDIAEKSLEKTYKKTVKQIMIDAQHFAQRGYFSMSCSFCGYNISSNSLKAAIIEELRNKGYKVRSYTYEDVFTIDWSEENEK